MTDTFDCFVRVVALLGVVEGKGNAGSVVAKYGEAGAFRFRFDFGVDSPEVNGTFDFLRRDTFVFNPETSSQCNSGRDTSSEFNIVSVDSGAINFLFFSALLGFECSEECFLFRRFLECTGGTSAAPGSFKW
jgi:hypothetical protein